MALIKNLKLVKNTASALTETIKAGRQDSANSQEDDAVGLFGKIGDSLNLLNFDTMIKAVDAIQQKNGWNAELLISFLNQLKSVNSADQLLSLAKDVPLKEVLKSAEQFSSYVPGMPIVVKILKWSGRLLSVAPISRLTQMKK